MLVKSGGGFGATGRIDRLRKAWEKAIPEIFTPFFG